MAQLQVIDANIARLGDAEKVTKDILGILSRDVVEYIMLDNGEGKPSEDSQVANRLLGCLTPMHRKVTEKFLRSVIAFHWDDENKKFIGKDKKNWQAKQEKAKQLLSDRRSNIWTWADKNVEIIRKPLDFAKLNQAMGQLIKKADKAQLGHDNIIRAMLANGITGEEILTVINAMANEAPDEKNEQPQAQPQEQQPAEQAA